MMRPTKDWRDDPQGVHEAFLRDGYVALRGFLDARALAALRAKLDRFIAEVVPTMPPEHVFYEEKGQRDTLKQLQVLQTYDPFFEALMFGSPFERLAELLLDGPVVGKNMQYFNKPPGVGRSTPPHQDGYYFMLDPCEAVTMWLALEEVDAENGCLHYVRGSHRQGMRPHSRTGTLGFSQGIIDFGTDEDRTHEVAFPAQPGDLLAHHAKTIHRAGGNQSQTRSRRALGFIYYAERAREDQAAHAAYQKKLASELEHAGKV